MKCQQLKRSPPQFPVCFLFVFLVTTIKKKKNLIHVAGSKCPVGNGEQKDTGVGAELVTGKEKGMRIVSELVKREPKKKGMGQGQSFLTGFTLPPSIPPPPRKKKV